MRPGDLLRESFSALRSSRSRTLLTGTGVTVGALALVLILSLSLGLSTVIDDLVATDAQLRQVVVMPSFGGRRDVGDVPDVEGAMTDEKRARLRRALKKRSRRGPSFQMKTTVIDDESLERLSSLPGVVESRAFLQDRFATRIGDVDGDVTLSLGAPAKHPYYPNRVLAGRWFDSDDERGVVVHELMLHEMGFIGDAAQAAVVGQTIVLSAQRARSGLMAMMAPGGGAGAAKPVYTLELPVVGVVRERFGMEPGSVVEEGWAMQTDLFLPIGLARELNARQEGRDGPPALLLVARSIDDVVPIEEAAEELGLRAQSVREVVERVKLSVSGVTVVASFLAGIAVFVSCLGIVNTMVMSVLERTREIGLLKALGATSRDVAALFLVEGALIGLGGGVIGMALALGLGALGNEYGRVKIEEAFQMPFAGTLFQFPGWLLFGGIGFAVGTSVIASLVPALRAARVDPVHALRHE